MKVLKFGGSSMGSAESIKKVYNIISDNNEVVHVVVSALGGTTDLLINAARKSAAGSDYSGLLEELYSRHVNTAEELQSGLQKSLLNCFDEKIGLLSNLLKGIELTGELSERSMNIVTGVGEQLSACILHALISGSVLFDSREYIKTVRNGSKNVVDFEITGKLLEGVKKKSSDINIWPGFISRDVNGDDTTLGRGGSDYTAAILAAAFDARILEIWTDVDGFMSGDPRVIRRAYSIEHLTYAEALELSHFGAKVIYPPTIIPVLRKGIPVLIKNTFNPDFSGTLIDNNSSDEKQVIKGVSSIRNIALITLHGSGLVGITGISKRFFSSLAGENINVILISQASSESSITVAVNDEEAENAVKALEYEFEREIRYREVTGITVEKEMAVVAIVGEGMKHTSGMAGRLFRSIGANGINLYAIAQGASELNISFVIKERHLRKALNIIHESFFLTNYRILNIFLSGIGTVGANLLQKIESHSEELMAKERVVLRLVGVSNSKKMIFDEEGLLPAGIPENIGKGEDSSPDKFTEKILELNFANSVFVDCTASADVAAVYEKLLNGNVSVVTANKIASSSSYDSYKKLKDISRINGVKYLFETNVGAGLPLISTINNMVNSGDSIIRIVAVLSGTLNFIVDELGKGNLLSEIIREAMEKGYSEPDPRIDLSGTDVLRKILILVRESGYKIEQEDILKDPFVPEKYLNTANVKEFLEMVRELDEPFAKKIRELNEQKKRLRYVASFEEGKARTGFMVVDSESPLYNLESSNNMVLLWSKYYNEHPMVIKGYGAGADVTAAGVFADIIRVANV
ncbi:MAG: bifunctional aspartate kinase/homoserine dehydrogenase I [Chlorobi bacterium]|nr:bifunctional aspartate kinase/homoserine dehydrogenase I [Chlorobiota bacterium]